jgi:hypothetical protein
VHFETRAAGDSPRNRRDRVSASELEIETTDAQSRVEEEETDGVQVLRPA